MDDVANFFLFYNKRITIIILGNFFFHFNFIQRFGAIMDFPNVNHLHDQGVFTITLQTIKLFFILTLAQWAMNSNCVMTQTHL